MKHLHLAAHRSHQIMIESSGLMIMGTALALLWANIQYEMYVDVVEFDFGTLWGIHFTPHFGANEILMAIFFGIAAKEIREAFLPEGALSNEETRMLPFIATAGGMAGPAVLFIILGIFMEPGLLLKGVAIAMATDIAFARLFGKIVYKSVEHSAVVFLTVLAIADDGGGLAVLAIFYQPWDFVALGIGGSLMAVAIAITRVMRYQLRIISYVPYAIPGVISWIALHTAGLHPALALVPIVFFMPHAKSDEGLYTPSHRNGDKRDTLNQFEHHFGIPMEFILLVFAFVNAGIVVGNIGPGTYVTFFALIIGKPLGVFTFAWVAMKVRGYALPPGMNLKDLLMVGMLAGVGFTVALFVAGVAFVLGDPFLEQTRLGAMLSFLAGFLAIGAAYLLKVGRFNPRGSSQLPETDPSEVDSRESVTV